MTWENCITTHQKIMPRVTETKLHTQIVGREEHMFQGGAVVFFHTLRVESTLTDGVHLYKILQKAKPSV